VVGVDWWSVGADLPGIEDRVVWKGKWWLRGGVGNGVELTL
jgi:hypothetical protein